MDVENAVYPGPGQAKEFFATAGDGPFVMVNLLRFKPSAAYDDGSDAHLTGREAYMRYGEVVRRLVEELGGAVRFTGDVTGLLLGEVEDLWDMVALAEYPSAEAFASLLSSPEMHAAERHRAAGLAGQLNIRATPLPS
jgi:uncharacterized protein (DUF1330 family)